MKRLSNKQNLTNKINIDFYLILRNKINLVNYVVTNFYI